CPRHADPLVGNMFRGQLMVPRESAERVPVRLREIMPAPVLIRAGVGHSAHAGQLMFAYRAVDRAADRRTWPGGMRVAVEEFLPHCRQVYQMIGVAQIFLSDLK